MQKRSLILLAAATLVLVALAIAALATGRSNVSRAGSDQTAFPGLADKLGQVASVAVERAGLNLTFVRDGDDWLVAQKGDYPADAGKVRRIVLAMADMSSGRSPRRKSPISTRVLRSKIREKGNRPWSPSRTNPERCSLG